MDLPDPVREGILWIAECVSKYSVSDSDYEDIFLPIVEDMDKEMDD